MIDRIRSRSVLATALFVSLCAFGNVYAAPQTTFAATTATLRAAPVHFDVHLPLRDQAELDALLAEMQDPVSPHFHHWLSPNEFARRFGPDSKQVDRVRSALQDAHKDTNRAVASTDRLRMRSIMGCLQRYRSRARPQAHRR